MGGGSVNAAALAELLGVTRARVSQYVAQGRLDGCFTGTGTDRRFDVAAVAARLNRVLHPGQMLGEGAATRRRLREIEAAVQSGAALVSRPLLQDSVRLRDDAELPASDLDRYELARTQKVEEEARRLRRQNLEAEGAYVLASVVEGQVARLIAQEVAEMEAALRDGARRVADEFGVDYKRTRRLLIEVWRAHRASRAAALAVQAEAAGLTDEEAEADV
jgi:DNA-binding transcriptional regulator YdaS (Cro superfamily)